MTFKTRATSGLVFARRAAAADVAGDDSRWQQAGNKSNLKDAGLLTSGENKRTIGRPKVNPLIN